jgi:hypothetical protein
VIASAAVVFVIVLFVLLAWWRFGRRGDKPAVEPAAAPASESPPAPAPPSEPSALVRETHPRRAVGLMTAAYVTFAVWTFYAWYRAHKPLSKYRFGGDGWMGVKTYAGGADKCGHAWATMALARLGTYILTSLGGFRRLPSSVVSAIMSELCFIGVEVRDGFFYEFSFSDLTGDTVGMVLALLLDNMPKLREVFAYRVEDFPSRAYARKIAGTSPCALGGCSRWNIAEDYSGQTYLAAFHLAGIPAVRNKLGKLSRFVDVAVEFDSRGYKPPPDADIAKPIRQDLFMGLSINAQGIFDTIFENRTSTAARRAKTITHGLFEVFNLPLGSARLFGVDRSGPVRALKPPPPRPALPSGSAS